MSTISLPDLAGEPGTSIFGTDGLRGHAGQGLLCGRDLRRIADATAFVLKDARRFVADFPAGRRAAPGGCVFIGRDTRSSGEDICAAFAGAFLERGYTVVDLGVLPTPGVACVACRWPEAALGVVISASHNPAEYNGIKYFAPTGAKISPAFELAVSDAFRDGRAPSGKTAGGRLEVRSDEAMDMYIDHLVRACRKPERLRGGRVVLDAANGAAFQAAPEVFRRLGLHVEAMGCEPDGANINRNCGALFPEGLSREVVSRQAAWGFCLDGDGDRMVPVTSSGKVLDGDHVLYLSGRSYRAAGKLPLRTVVATVMSNVGLEAALRREGVVLVRTDVGDRNVYAEMVRGGHPVGGEQSGHTIFLDDARTGDGILAAIRCLDMLQDEALDLERETSGMQRCPQVLRNVRVLEKRPLGELPLLARAVEDAERSLGGAGRVLLRYSGTEPLLRVMVEGPGDDVIDSLARVICETARPLLNPPTAPVQ